MPQGESHDLPNLIAEVAIPWEKEISPNSLRARERMYSEGFSCVFLDLDDTVIATQELFDNRIREFAQYASDKTGESLKELSDTLNEYDAMLFKVYGIDPSRIEASALLTLSHSWPKGIEKDSEAFAKAVQIVREIYTSQPGYLDGSESAMQVLTDAIPTLLVTSSDVEWANWKIDQLGIRGRFAGTVIWPSKTSDRWLKLTRRLGITPDQALVLDNSSKNTQRAREVGIPSITLHNPYTWRELLVADKSHEVLSLGTAIAGLIEGDVQHLHSLNEV